MSQKNLILAFDFSGKSWAFRKKIWRELQQIGAELRYGSHWTLPFSKKNLNEFRRICVEIRKFGGKAEVIVGEKIV